MMFTDDVTVYHKVSDGMWSRKVVHGVQWSDKTEKQNNNGRISVAGYVSITFPQGTYEKIVIKASSEEDCIIYGIVDDEIVDKKGCRISDLLKKYPKSGIVKVINDNSNRSYLKNVKVVLG